ncbi:hypothetical protein NW752_003966 [Fusarium irregulare]|nr:hypothetical protein NW752_003966 [Fusarium irregulare]
MAKDRKGIHQMSGGSHEQLLSPQQGEASAAHDVSTPQDTTTAQDALPSQETPTPQGSSGHGVGISNSVVEVRETGTERGRGVFATQDLFANLRIINDERPIMSGNPYTVVNA